MDSMAKQQENLKPIIFWNGFPVCALILKQVAETLGNNVVIVGTKSNNHYQKTEEMLGHKVIWFDDPNDIWKRKEEFTDRNLIIHTGWVYHGWWKYDRYMRRKGAKIVVMVDNRYRGDFRQYVGAVLFRLRMRKFFDAVLVPGKEGVKLMKFLGMKKSRIYTGLYGAYEKIYFETTPISDRNKEFLFVGQLIKRKSVDVLIKALNSYRERGGTWSLRIIGDGPLKELCEGSGIIYEPFLDPEEIAKRMNSAQVFVLPSKDDNWGTVVCEAAACGMNLITTKNVGASKDIVLGQKNGIIIDDLSVKNLTNALFYFENLTESELEAGSKISKEIARNFTSNTFFNSLKKIINDLFKINL